MDKLLKGMQNRAAPIVKLLNGKLKDYPAQGCYWYGTQRLTKCFAGEGSIVAELILTIIHLQADLALRLGAKQGYTQNKHTVLWPDKDRMHLHL